MRIVGFWSGHDASVCILDDGLPTLHAEYERFLREKEPKGDSLKFLKDIKGEFPADAYVTCEPKKYYECYDGYDNMQPIVVGHHKAHAANAFFSSRFDEALIITMDGGGIDDGAPISSSYYRGRGNKIEVLKNTSADAVNIGSLWTRCTRYIFGLQSGWPTGHQAGTVMAMASLGIPKYKDMFIDMFFDRRASFKPPGQPAGANIGTDPKHPYLDPWRKLADRSEKEKFNIAASLQAATEAVIDQQIHEAESMYGQPIKNICLAGGVSLNSVAVGKLTSRFNVYVPPTPHDGGLSIGAAQYYYHQILDKPRINKDFSPYLGLKYSSHEIYKGFDTSKFSLMTDEDALMHLERGEIVAIFNGRAESGKRALGNRSILADPRSNEMKSIINEKVKHRQWFRPFAPSILREEVSNWFERDVDSPYMSVVINFRKDKLDKVPAVVHHDGTGRLQTVTHDMSPWYYNFIKQWHERTGVPILLNTSFNDREPICETPEHAVNCFKNTDIDYLYFPEHGLGLKK